MQLQYKYRLPLATLNAYAERHRKMVRPYSNLNCTNLAQVNQSAFELYVFLCC